MTDPTWPARQLPPGPHAPVSVPLEPSSGGSVSLGYVIGVIRRRFRWIITAMLVGGVLGGFIARRTPAAYQANAVLQFAGERRALTEDIEAQTPQLGRADPLLSLTQLIRSRSVIGAVIDSLGLQLRSRDPDAFPITLLSNVKVDPRVASDSIMLSFDQQGVTGQYQGRQARAAYGSPLHLGPVEFQVNRPPSVRTATLGIVPREVAVDGLLPNIVVSQRPGTDIIDLTYTNGDPVLAQRVVNATVQTFQAMDVQSARETSRKRREFLEDQLRQSDSTLARAQAELSSFRSRRQLASSQSKMEAQQNAILALDSRLSEMQSDRSTYGTLLGELKTGGDSVRAEALRALATSPALTDNATVNTYYQQLTTYQNRLDSMTTGPWRAAPTNPDVLQLQHLITSTKGQLQQAIGSHVGSLDARIRSLQGLRARSGQAIEVLPALAEEESRLEARVQSLTTMGDQLRADFQKARMAETVEAGDVDIVDLAGVPYAPVLSSATLKLAIGVLLGLMLGLGLSFLLEATNTSIRRPEDLEVMLHVPGLAVIPRLSSKAALQRPKLARLVGSRSGATPEQSRAAALGTLSHPFSVGTEAFRMLRTSLLWSDPGRELRTIVVTSAGPGEGKTLTAANLAVSFAHDGLRVLLVDCDVRRPRLHGLFRVPRGPGLMELLTPANAAGGARSLSFQDGSEEDAAGVLQAVLRPTPVRGLSVLTCGALPTNPSELLSGGRMRALLTQLNQEFDLIVLDTPPVLATADAGILATLADGVLLVVRAGQTDRAAAQRAHQHLAHVGARVVGAVLNDPGGEVRHYGDYYYPYDYSVDRE
jgi:tyrosine-protein kinase Etk/Wzc